MKSTVHYSFVDGGAMTAPDNAIFDPRQNKPKAQLGIEKHRVFFPVPPVEVEGQQA